MTSAAETTSSEAASSAASMMTTMANANVHSRVAALRAARRQRPRAMPVQIAAMTANSGPTTIAPTTRTAESVMTAMLARAVAMQRNTR